MGQRLCHPQKILVFCLENSVRIVTTKKGKRKKLIACYFSKIITLIMQSLFLPTEPQKLKRNYCASLSLLWAFDQLTHMINKWSFFTCMVNSRGWGVGGGGTSYNGLSGEAPHKEIPFSSLSIWLGVWISLVEAYETAWKSIISDCKKTQKGNRCILSWLWKSRENGLVLRYIHILKTVHLKQLKGIQGSKLSG